MSGTIYHLQTTLTVALHYSDILCGEKKEVKTYTAKQQKYRNNPTEKVESFRRTQRSKLNRTRRDTGEFHACKNDTNTIIMRVVIAYTCAQSNSWHPDAVCTKRLRILCANQIINTREKGTQPRDRPLKPITHVDDALHVQRHARRYIYLVMCSCMSLREGW